VSIGGTNSTSHCTFVVHPQLFDNCVYNKTFGEADAWLLNNPYTVLINCTIPKWPEQNRSDVILKFSENVTVGDESEGSGMITWDNNPHDKFLWELVGPVPNNGHLTQIDRENSNAPRTNPVPISNHPFGKVLKLGRMSKGRSLFELSTTHMVDRRYIEPVKMSSYALAVYHHLGTTLRNVVGDHKSVHLYSLAPGHIERSPASSEGIHIYFGVMDSKLEAIGFKCIPLNKDPGRLGACLRVMLINYLHGKTIFVHSGRPGLHVLASEFVANKVEHRTNTVVGPWSTPSPFLDGYVNTDGLSWHNQFALMSTGHFYHEIYGIDEACFSRLEISKLIFSRQKGVPYSTNGLTSENMQRLDNLLLDDIEPLLDGFAVPLPIIVKSAKDVNSTWDLVRSIDPMIGSNSREFQPNSASAGPPARHSCSGHKAE